MSATLPHGFITISHTNISSDGSWQKADVLFQRSSVLHSFWKVHAIRHRVSRDPSDLRCENLFWRAWGDTKLSREITTAALTALWSACQQRIDLVTLRHEYESKPLISQKKPCKTSHESQHSFASSNDINKVVQNLSSSSSFNPQSEQYSSSARDSSETKASPGDDSKLANKDGGSKGSSKSSRPTINRAISSSTRLPIGTPIGRTKGRPSFNRRKSSQNAMQVKPARSGKAVTKSPILASVETDKQKIPLPTTESMTFELPPASSWEDEPTSGHGRVDNSTSRKEIPSELVDSDFRNKFAERIASSSNLVGISRLKKTGSVVRFVDEDPIGWRNNNEIDCPRPASKDEHRPSLMYRTSSASIASVAVIDEDEGSTSELPRTKSQLSIMIENRRSRHGSFESVTNLDVDNHDISGRHKTALTDDEKVLAMAHAEGVTKEGGRQIRKGFTLGDGEEERYSSPSPSPLF